MKVYVLTSIDRSESLETIESVHSSESSANIMMERHKMSDPDYEYNIEEWPVLDETLKCIK